MYPFFIECSKIFETYPQRQKTLQRMALGHGVHIIVRKRQSIVVMDNGEFCIPDEYSDKARDQFIHMLWGDQASYDALQTQIDQQRAVWQTTKKKDKTHLFYSFVAKLPCSLEQKKIIADLIIIAFFLKMIQKQDLVYQNAKIDYIHPRLFHLDTFLMVDQQQPPPTNSLSDTDSEPDE